MKQEPHLRPQHRKVMRALSELHYANYLQITKHGFSLGSYTHVSEATGELIAWGYVAYDFEKRGGDTGRAKRIATYTKRGRDYCAREMPEELLPFTTPHHDVYFQEHKRGVADLIIAARQFVGAHAGRVRLVRAQNDLITGRSPVIVPMADGKGAKIIPDLWLELTVDGASRPLAIEYDRGTEKNAAGERQWRDKVRKYVAGLRGPLPRHFDVATCMVATVINPERADLASKRMQTLIAWTEKELEALFADEENRGGWGRLFLFAAADPATCNPTALFTAPWWVAPFDPTPRALIAIETGSNAAR